MIPLRRLISSVFRWSRFCDVPKLSTPVIGVYTYSYVVRATTPRTLHRPASKSRRDVPPRNLRSQSRRRSASNTVESRSLFPAHPALSSFTARSTTAKGRSADCWVCNTTTDSKEAARINVTCFIYGFSCSAEVVVVREHHCLRASPDA